MAVIPLLLVAVPGPCLLAQDLLPPERIPVSSLVQSEGGRRLSSGDRVYGDIDLAFDYKLAPDEKAALYLQGVYEVPLAGWPPHEGLMVTPIPGSFEAARSAGLWQHLHLVFRAARSEAGKPKTAARIESAEENNYPLTPGLALTPAAGAPLTGESRTGPVVFASDHTLQLRNLELRPLASGAQAALDVTQIQLLKGWNAQAGAALTDADWSNSTPLALKATLNQVPLHAAARFSGSLRLPAAQKYALAAHTNGIAQIFIDGALVLGPVALAAGPHRLQVTFVRQEEEGSNLSIEVAAPALAPQTFHLGGTKPKPNPERHSGAPILKLATDKIVVQRAFVPFPGGERLEAISVGTPQQLNYTYDLDRGTLLRAWRGRFLDMYNMWHERGEAQIAVPLGAPVVFDGQPAFGETLQPGGYDLESNGQPVFTAHFHGRTITDRIAPNPSGSGLTRTLKISAGPEAVTISLARGGEMARLDGNRYAASDSSYFIDWHSPSSEVHPVISGQGASAALTVTLPASSRSQEISYDLSW